MKKIKGSYGYIILKSMLFSVAMVIIGYNACSNFTEKYGPEIAMIRVFKIAIIVVLVYQVSAAVAMMFIPMEKYKDDPLKHSAIGISTVMLPLALLMIIYAIPNHFTNIIDAKENVLITKELSVIPATIEVVICIVASTAIWLIGMFIVGRNIDVVNPSIKELFVMIALCFVMINVQSICVWIFYHANTPGYPLTKRDMLSLETGAGLLFASAILLARWVKKQLYKEGER